MADSTCFGAGCVIKQMYGRYCFLTNTYLWIMIDAIYYHSIVDVLLSLIRISYNILPQESYKMYTLGPLIMNHFWRQPALAILQNNSFYHSHILNNFYKWGCGFCVLSLCNSVSVDVEGGWWSLGLFLCQIIGGWFLLFFCYWSFSFIISLIWSHMWMCVLGLIELGWNLLYIRANICLYLLGIYCSLFSCFKYVTRRIYNSSDLLMSACGSLSISLLYIVWCDLFFLFKVSWMA